MVQKTRSRETKQTPPPWLNSTNMAKELEFLSVFFPLLLLFSFLFSFFRVCVCVCVCAWVRACMRVCKHVCVCDFFLYSLCVWIFLVFTIMNITQLQNMSVHLFQQWITDRYIHIKNWKLGSAFGRAGFWYMQVQSTTNQHQLTCYINAWSELAFSHILFSTQGCMGSWKQRWN